MYNPHKYQLMIYTLVMRIYPLYIYRSDSHGDHKKIIGCAEDPNGSLEIGPTNV